MATFTAKQVNRRTMVPLLLLVASDKALTLTDEQQDRIAELLTTGDWLNNAAHWLLRNGHISKIAYNRVMTLNVDLL